MSRTYKKYYGGYFRSTKGRKNAIVNEARPKAIPRDSYDDIDYDRQCLMPHKIAKKLYKKGVQPNNIVQKLMKKYGIRYDVACECLPYEAKWE